MPPRPALRCSDNRLMSISQRTSERTIHDHAADVFSSAPDDSNIGRRELHQIGTTLRLVLHLQERLLLRRIPADAATSSARVLA